LPEENKYIVEDGFMSREEIIESKYAIFVPHHSDLFTFPENERSPL